MRFIRNVLCIFLSCCLFVPNVLAHGSGGGSLAGAPGEKGESISSDAMINSPTATTLGRNHVSAEFSFDYVRYNSIPAANAHRLHHRGRDVHGKNHEQFYNMSVGYGVLEDLDFFLTAPVVSKNSIDIHGHDTLGRKERATGFGDMGAFVMYRFWKKYVEAAFLGGIKFPTGKTNARRDSGDKFAAELQPGSGSWDGEFGLALSRSFKDRISLATSFQYGLNGEGGQDHKMGDVFHYNFGSSFSVRPLGESPNLSFVLELNNEWALKDHSREEDRVFDSGGTTVFISPGVQVRATKNLSFFWSAPIPIYQNLGGEHEELKFETIAGASLYF